MKYSYRKAILILIMVLLSLQGCTSIERDDALIGSAEKHLEAAIPEPEQSEIKENIIPLEEILSEGDLEHFFNAFDNGAMIISDGVSAVSYNEPFTRERHSPCSTFKIPHSLIALETGVITVNDSYKEWNGIVYNRSELNQDQDLASAMKHSCVWYYQILAGSIGADTMQEYLNRLNYGNTDISGGIDSFWLNSSLLISPEEQLDFIIRLYNNQLPFKAENMDYVKSIMRQDGYPLEVYGKTGSSGDGMGWFVGYSIINRRPLFFATYIESRDASGLVARDLTVEIMENLKQNMKQQIK